MSGSCPGCGAPGSFEPRESRVLRGVCAQCGGTFTIVEERFPPGSPESGAGTPGEAVGAGAEPEGAARAALGVVPTCAACGASLTIRSWDEAGVEAACADCGTTVVYRAAPPAGREDRPRRFERAPRGEDRGAGPPRARPCRECGGPLRFTTGDDGTVTGECDSCGNRFTLRPRQGTGRWSGGPRGPPRGGRGRFPPGRDRGGFDRRRPGASYDRRAKRPDGYRARDRAESSDDGEDRYDRRRRRPRRD